MKTVQVTEKDRAILKACAISSVIGERTSIDNVRSLFKANDKLKVDDAPTDIDAASGEKTLTADLEDAELAALKAMCIQGRKNLRSTQVVLRAVLDCDAHLEAAKEKSEEKPAKEAAQ